MTTRTLASRPMEAVRSRHAGERAPFARGDRRQARLRRALNALDTPKRSDRLWQHQAEALAAFRTHFAADRDRPNAIAVIPTAGGKTEIFGRIVVAHARAAGPDDKPTIILVPTRNLVTQTIARLAGMGLQTVSRRWPIAPGRVAHAVVLTYAAFQDLVHAGRLDPDDIDLLILDEAHCALSELRRPALEQFETRCPILAFSATPAYDLMKNIYAVLGRENEVIAITPELLRQRGVIAPAINYVLAISMTGTVPEDGRDLVRQFRIAARDAILEFRREHVEADLGLVVREKHFIGYHATCADATIATAHHNSQGDEQGLVASISGTDSNEMQDRTILALRKGEIVGVNNANLLIEGTDVPTVGAVMNFVPTYSLVREIQRCGRALRLDPRYDAWDPRQTSVIIDVFFEINGRMIGRPRFYFEVVNDPSIARIVRAPAVAFGAGTKAKIKAKPKPGTPGKVSVTPAIPNPPVNGTDANIRPLTNSTLSGYVISSDVRAVQYLVETRDRSQVASTYDRWLTREEITASFVQTDPERTDTVFSEIETEVRGKTFGVVHEIGARRIRVGTYLRSGNPAPVYDPEQKAIFAGLLDHAPRKITARFRTGLQILGLRANDPDCLRQLESLERACLKHRRDTGAAEITHQFPNLTQPIRFDLMRVGHTKRIAFELNSVEAVAQACGVKRYAAQDPDLWVGEAAVLPQVEPSAREATAHYLKAWNYRYDHKADAAGILTVETPQGAIRLARLHPENGDSHHALAIHRDDVERFLVSRHGSDDAEDGDWVSLKAAQNRIIENGDHTLRDAWKAVIKSETENPLTTRTRTLRNGQKQIQIHVSDLPRFETLLRQAYEATTAPLGADWLTPGAVIDTICEHGIDPIIARMRFNSIRNRLAKPELGAIVLKNGRVRIKQAPYRGKVTTFCHKSDIAILISYILDKLNKKLAKAKRPAETRKSAMTDLPWLDDQSVLARIEGGKDYRKASLKLKALTKSLSGCHADEKNLIRYDVGSGIVIVKRCTADTGQKYLFERSSLEVLTAYLLNGKRHRSTFGAEAGHKNDDWVRIDRLARQSPKQSLGRKLADELIETLSEAFARDPEPTMSCAGHSFTVKRIRHHLLGTEVASIMLSDYETLMTRLNDLSASSGLLPEHMYTRRMCVKSRSYDPGKLESLWADLIKQYERGPAVSFNGHPVEAGYYRHKKMLVFAVDVATAKRIRKAVRKYRPKLKR